MLLILEISVKCRISFPRRGQRYLHKSPQKTYTNLTPTFLVSSFTNDRDRDRSSGKSSRPDSKTPTIIPNKLTARIGGRSTFSRIPAATTHSPSKLWLLFPFSRDRVSKCGCRLSGRIWTVFGAFQVSPRC